MDLFIEIIKKEIVQINWAIWVGYFPLGIIGVWRWSVWALKKTVAFFYKNPEGQYKASLSIVTPVYNEDTEIFKMALLSWKRNNPKEIIAVIDYTDKKCIKIFEEFSKNFAEAKLIITHVRGKRAALADGINVAAGEIVALVDSDTIWTEDFKEKVLGPFEDKKVGGVAPRQDVMEVDSLAKKLFRIHIFNRYGNDLIFQAAFGNALSCISGRTGIYRRSAIAHLTKELVNEKFLGKKCISGDDKTLTNFIQRDGWLVKYVERALVYTPGFPDMKTYTKQQIRWTRNSWRADLTSVFSRWLWRNPFLAFHTIDRFFQPFTLLLGPIFFAIALYRGDWIVAVILVIWWLFSRSMKIIQHLIKHPSDFLILPLYIIYCYVLAVIKIFTLLTVDEQGWITRWDKKRLQRRRLYRKMPSYMATGAIVTLLFFISFQLNVSLVGGMSFLEKARLEKIKAERKLFKTDEESQLRFANELQFQEQKNLLYQKLTADQYAYYQVKFGETLADIKRRYLLPPNAVILNKNKIILNNRRFVRTGEKIVIPIEELRQPDLEFYRQKSLTKIRVVSYPEQNAIRVYGKGAFVTIAELARAINNKNVLENIEGKNWILRKNIFIDNGVTLIIDGAEVDWLKLKSDRQGFVWIKSENGNIIIDKTKITSWDEEKSDYDFDWQDGRSYVLQKSDGRMDINKSELAYLGYLGAPNRGNPFGGPYGVSWKITNGSFRQELSTGSLTENRIHDNFFGAYAYGITGAIFRDNDVFDNVEYGLDPHDDSNNMLIENNRVYRNGKHGIIISKRCFANIIRGNLSQGNRLHGIMLDRDSNNNLVENNYSIGNVNGVALYHSSENLIIDNNIAENEFGIRANNFSKDNYFWYNKITNNRKGIFIYQESPDNYIFQNNLMDDEVKIQLKQNSPGFFDEELQ